MAAAGGRIRRGPSREFTNTTKTPLNMVAMFNAVGIHDASSNPNPFTPRRSARPTPTSRAFSVAIPAPRNTPAIPKYGFVYGAAGACDSVAVGLTSDTLIRLSPSVRGGPNRRDHRQPGAQPIQFRLPRLQQNFHRNALNNFREISGGVIGRQESELRPARGRDLIDLTPERDSWKRVDLDFRFVACVNVTDLRFLVIRLHPNIALHQRDHLGSGADELPCPDISFAYDAILGRQDPGVAQVRLREGKCCALGVQIGPE